MSEITPFEDYEEYRDHLATVDDKGKRIWVYPKKPKGKFTSARTYLSWVFLIFLFGVPFIKVNGEPLMLFNILKRHFIVFGVSFAPQDFHLFVLAMLTFVVFIILFTVIYGRLFCGWVCPQTVFMEMVYRKIEYLIEGDANAQRRLNNSPWTSDKIIKKLGKQAIFFAIAVLISNTFLAYIIGIDEVYKIATEPVSQNLTGFIAMLVFSFAFYFVFAWMREQICIAICPYGRLQGVLLDKNSIVVHYDHVRGEPRGKIQRETANKPISPISSIQSSVLQSEKAVALEMVEALPPAANPIEAVQKSLGDCIDCKLCIHVCPTGIDIRNGTQLECVNCTACIDACDEVMDKVSRPRGLIRYASATSIETKTQKVFTTRVKAYSVVLALMVILNIVLFSMRTDVEVLLLRTPGMLFQKVGENKISNLYNYEIINKTRDTFPIEFRLVKPQGVIKLVGKTPYTKASEVTEGAMFVEIERKNLGSRKTRIEVDVYSNGKKIDRVKTNFLGPI
jgi:polyferredoxin